MADTRDQTMREASSNADSPTPAARHLRGGRLDPPCVVAVKTEVQQAAFGAALVAAIADQLAAGQFAEFGVIEKRDAEKLPDLVPASTMIFRTSPTFC
jgi:hypothetical protein